MSTGSGLPVVLIVEDEALIRAVAVSIVEHAGFEAMEAANADDAVKILEARKDIRLVFTDIQMPGSMDGLQLASAIRDRWPPIGLIITSGNMTAPLMDLPDRSHYIPKPYTLFDVMRALNKLVAR